MFTNVSSVFSQGRTLNIYSNKCLCSGILFDNADSLNKVARHFNSESRSKMLLSYSLSFCCTLHESSK